MNFVYNTAIRLYSFGAKVFALKDKKANLMISGQKKTMEILRNEIDRNEKYVWIHVSSLGEFEQGRPLIEMIKRENPNQKILLTFFSPSGYEVCKNYQLADTICYLPFDTPSKVKKFLDAVNIDKAIFVKYEFWGNYLSQLKKRGIPTYIISAIFRPTQMFFKPYGGMFRKMLDCYNTIFVQDQESQDLLASIGVTNVEICGDTRFDRVTDILENKVDLPIVETFTRSQYTLFVGSSWQPDEEFIIPFFNSHPEMKMVIAPHEISEERINGILAKIKRPVALYTKTTPESAADADCLIIDCFGILSKSYRFATVVYVGGGFGVGIHNINEAAVYGVPVIFGPKYHKFKEARDLIELEGAFCVNNAKEYSEIMDKLISDGNYLSQHGEIAGEYIKKHLGATKKIFAQIFKK